MTIAIATISVPGDLPAKLSAIANAGFKGVEICNQDLIRFDGSAADVATMAGNNGLDIVLLQAMNDLEGLSGEDRVKAFDRLERKFDVMQTLGTDLLLVNSSTNTNASGHEDLLVSDLAELADRAGKRSLRAAYMALPWARHVSTDIAAWRLLEKADKSNLGIGLNSFCTLAGGTKFTQLGDIPGHRIQHVQIADAPKVEMDLRHLSHHFRAMPGQGDLNLEGFVRVVSLAGYNGAWSLEGFNAVVRDNDCTVVCQDAYRALVNLLDQVARTNPKFKFDIPELPERVSVTGFEFIEFTAGKTDALELKSLLTKLGFRQERHHASKSVELWRQGAVNIVINTEQEGFARSSYLEHGPSVCDMGVRVKDAKATVERAGLLGTPKFSQPLGTGELNIPAIRGVGGNVVHFIDEKSELHRVWDIEFNSASTAKANRPVGVRRIDHVAQTMKFEEMHSWLLYYISTFQMEKSAIIGVEDPSGLVHSQALESPEGEVRLNLNGTQTDRTIAGSFLKDRLGAGVQHIAFLTDDILETSEQLEELGFDRLNVTANYYTDLRAKFSLEDDLVEQLRSGSILYDRVDGSEYFQIYSLPIFGGFFFEIVERRNGYAGYGARNAPIRIAAQQRLKKQLEVAAS